MGKNKFSGLFYKRGLAVLAIIGCILFGFSGCLPEDFYLLQTGEEMLPESGGERKIALEEIERRAAQHAPEDGKEDAEEATEEGDNEESEEEDIRDGSCRYAYRKLSESERLWYADMVRAISTMTDKVKLSEKGIQAGLDEEVVDKIFQYVLSDHPEFFYVEGYTYTKYTRAEKTVAIEFSGAYPLDLETVQVRKTQIEAEADRLLAQVPAEADDYEKTKYVYETLILNTDYDMSAEDNQNIYSVFVNHTSVCQGYAKAAQYLLNRMGVECMLVQGIVMETGERHAWNLVKMDGDYYFMDPTWGDISYQMFNHLSNDELTQITYDYLGITTSQLIRTHRIGSLVTMPYCAAKKDNYYVREGAVFAEYDREQLKDLIERARQQGRKDITFRCEDRNCYDAMCEALLYGQEIFDYIPGNEVRSFAYTTNDKQLTLTFFMMTNKQ